MLQGSLPPCLFCSDWQACPIKALQTLGGQQLYQTCVLQIRWLLWVNLLSFVSVISPICFPALSWMLHTPSTLKLSCCHPTEVAHILRTSTCTSWRAQEHEGAAHELWDESIWDEMPVIHRRQSSFSSQSPVRATAELLVSLLESDH